MAPKSFNIKDNLEGLLTHDHVAIRSYGRLVATGLLETFSDWITSEASRGTNWASLMTASSLLAAHIHKALILSEIPEFLPKEMREFIAGNVIEQTMSQFKKMITQMVMETIKEDSQRK